MAETVIIDIKVSNAEAVKNIEDATAAINELKQSEKSLKEQYDKQLITYDQYIKSLASIRSMRERNTQVLAANRKALKDNIKTEQEHSDSLNRMRQTLRQMLGEYDKLSKAEREGAKGQDMLKHIQDLTNELNEAEQASGRFQRNVGNYKSALSDVGKIFNSAGGEVSNLMNKTKGFGDTLKILTKNPFFIILRVVIGLFTLLASQIKKSDDAMTSLDKLSAAFKPVMDALRVAIEKVVQAFTAAVEWITKAAQALGRWLGLSSESIDENQNLVVSMDALEDKEREYAKNSAKWNREAAEAREIAGDAENYTMKQRLEALDVVSDAEQKNLKAKQKIVEEKLRLAKLEAKMNKDDSDDTKNRIAELEAELDNLVAEASAAERSINKQRQSIRKQAAAQAKTRLKTELAERRALEDAVLAMVVDGIEKEKELLRVTNRRQIEDLKTRLKEEKDLTKAARAAINEQIILAEAKLQLDLEKIDKENRQRIARAQLEYERVLSAAEAAATKQYYDAQTLAYKNALNERLLAAKDNAEETAWIQEQEARRALDIATMKQKGILRLNYETEEAYQLALEQANSAVIEAQQNVADAAKKTAEAIQATKDTTAKAVTDIAGNFNTIAGNFEDLFTTLAENDDRYSDYATAMAYLQILVSTAVSIANAIQGATAAAASTGVAAPFTLPSFITEMVGIVTGAIAQTTSLMMKAQNKPTYAEGGVIHGAGTGTSDSITARVSNGESVMTAKATSMFYDQLSAMNVAGGGRPFDRRGGNRFAKGGVVSTQTLMSGRQMQELGRAMAEAVENIHPVVSVREITNVQNKIDVKERISRL